MLRALIVEDDIAQQKIYCHLLTRAGFQIAAAYNAKEAIQHLNTNDFPHLIITDVKMPQGNALELLQYLQTYPYLNHIHVVIATAGVAHEQQYLQYKTKLPSVDYMLKPEILSAIPAILQRYQ